MHLVLTIFFHPAAVAIRWRRPLRRRLVKLLHRVERGPWWTRERILAVADAYVNMTTERSFAPAKSSGQALAELERLSGIRYDGMLVRVLLRQLKSERASSSLGS